MPKVTLAFTPTDLAMIHVETCCQSSALPTELLGHLNPVHSVISASEAAHPEYNSMNLPASPAPTIMLLEVRNSSTAQNSWEHKRTLPKDAVAGLHELQRRDVEAHPRRNEQIR